MRECLTTPEFAQLIGVTVRQLHYWSQKRLLIPDRPGRSARGEGSLYHLSQVKRARICRRMMDATNLGSRNIAAILGRGGVIPDDSAYALYRKEERDLKFFPTPDSAIAAACACRWFVLVEL
jgi:DNA-binding transcriptional MerR regulator